MNDYKIEILDPGDAASRLAKEINVASYSNCPAVTIIPHQPDNFRGPVGYLWDPGILKAMAKGAKTDPGNGRVISWDIMEEVENDGAGGKPQFFSLIGTPEIFYNLGWEIITMTADDLARSGRLPCIMVNELQAKKITGKNFHLVKSMFRGYGDALRQSNLVNITGEIAIMKHSITAFCDIQSDEQLLVTWGGTCIGLARKNLLLDPKNIKPNMPVVGFLEKGYRCNGGTFFTNLILRKWGTNIINIINDPDCRKFVEKLTVPSISYAKTICRLIGWHSSGFIDPPQAKIAGIAHITGGGVWGKFGEMLPSGIGANLYNMPKPPEILQEAQDLSREFPDPLSDYDAYSTLHGGCGMLIVALDYQSADMIIDEAHRDGIEAMVVGITNDTGALTIESRFRNYGEKLVRRKED